MYDVCTTALYIVYTIDTLGIYVYTKFLEHFEN